MLFNSLEFGIFLPIVFLLYWFVFNKNLRIQNLFIIIASYLFYGWWDWRFLLLIASTALTSYACGLLIDKNKTEKVLKWYKNKSLIAAATNIILNIGILFYFKYFNFFIDNFAKAFSLLGNPIETATLDILLPIGISFYTFQAISYTIDIYRQRIKATTDLISFFAYISFFPQLVAGPIERATQLLPQFFKPRTFAYDKATDGMRQILWGLFKKIVIADNCGRLVNIIFENHHTESASTLILGVIYFSFQIYGDFSGYSDIAIGTARLFGFELMQNFKFPYFSRNVSEFWRRWHISLTTWFRDYIYIPLGGSRQGKAKTIRNTCIVFLISGFWHGANWTFIAWGAFHALVFLPLLVFNKNRKYLTTIAEGRKLPNLKETVQMLSTFMLVAFSRIFFRASTIDEAFSYIGRIFSHSIVDPIQHLSISLLGFIFIMLAFEWFNREKQHGLNISGTIQSNTVRYSIYYILSILIFVFGGEELKFIYFQF